LGLASISWRAILAGAVAALALSFVLLALATGFGLQMALFMGVGLLLSAFIAGVPGASGGLRRDDMHVHYWTERARARGVTPAPH